MFLLSVLRLSGDMLTGVSLRTRSRRERRGTPSRLSIEVKQYLCCGEISACNLALASFPAADRLCTVQQRILTKSNLNYEKLSETGVSP